MCITTARDNYLLQECLVGNCDWYSFSRVLHLPTSTNSEQKVASNDFEA